MDIDYHYYLKKKKELSLQECLLKNQSLISFQNYNYSILSPALPFFYNNSFLNCLLTISQLLHSFMKQCVISIYNSEELFVK